MYCAGFIVIVSLAGCLMHPLTKHEPKCHSRFDYDEKLLEKLVRLELTMEMVLSRVEDTEKTSKLAIADMENSFKVQEKAAEASLLAAADQSKVATDLAIADMKQTSLDLDNSFEAQKDAAEKTLAAAAEKAELAVTAMQKRVEASLKPSVIFHARDVSPQPTANNVIKFKKIIENVGGGYSQATGCFTASTPGGYWFSAQLCTHTDRKVSPSLYIRDSLASRAYVWDKDWGACGSVTAVATLKVGDTVCLKAGPIQTTGPVWSDERYNSNNFMGAIIN